MNNAWGWLGTITGITGALLVALNIDEVFTGYIFFMLSVAGLFKPLKTMTNL